VLGGIFLKSLAFGFLLAATVGPMWVLCLRRTLAEGVRAGLASGLGIAVADAIYGAVAAFGLTAVSGLLLEHRTVVGALGAAFLAWLGIKALAAAPVLEPSAPAASRSLGGAFLSTLGLTLANPPTILAFAAVFAGLGLASSADYASAALVVLAVFIGSASWWVALALGAGRLRGRLGPRVARGINVASGVFILGFALWQLARLAS
jgi:threonine/homoserine/homoserine lactone efflux protein